LEGKKVKRREVNVEKQWTRIIRSGQRNGHEAAVEKRNKGTQQAFAQGPKGIMEQYDRTGMKRQKAGKADKYFPAIQVSRLCQHFLLGASSFREGKALGNEKYKSNLLCVDCV
jgi:hypothetical protein